MIANMFAVNRISLGDAQSCRLREPCSRGAAALDVGNNVVDVLDADGMESESLRTLDLR
jgi:hypothetical protein